MKFFASRKIFPNYLSIVLSIFSAILLTLAFPDFEFWFLAYIALIPLFFAIEREKESFVKSAITGWIFGVTFFTATCWWLTFAPINYGGVPAPLAYLLLLGATSVVGLFPALFGGLFSLILKRFGTWGIFIAPFLWTAIEFLRFWTTGNNWNAIAYSQAFENTVIQIASIGGIYLTSYTVILFNSALYFWLFGMNTAETKILNIRNILLIIFFIPLIIVLNFGDIIPKPPINKDQVATIIAIQPNVPMSGLGYQEWKRYRERHLQLAESELQKLTAPLSRHRPLTTIVIFPESPMNFGWTQDREFQEYLRNFTTKNNVQVLFNAGEPSENKSFYNSAVLVNEKAEKIAQYDKIHLVPFGEYVPLPEPLASIVPSMVGNFEIGKEYDIIPLGEAKAGIMICFESHFPTLSRQYALNGADVIVEMTNDGYLGQTPILRQHLANAVFRAVETNRPILRVTNVGITAYINERGEISEATKPYTEDTRVWSISKSEGSQTFYVKYGDWFAWLCSLISLGVLLVGFLSKKNYSTEN